MAEKLLPPAETAKPVDADKAREVLKNAVSTTAFLEELGIEIAEFLSPDGRPVAKDGVEIALKDGSVARLMPDGSLVLDPGSDPNQDVSLLLRTKDGDIVEVGLKLSHSKGKPPAIVGFKPGGPDALPRQDTAKDPSEEPEPGDLEGLIAAVPG